MFNSHKINNFHALQYIIQNKQLKIIIIICIQHLIIKSLMVTNHSKHLIKKEVLSHILSTSKRRLLAVY